METLARVVLVVASDGGLAVKVGLVQDAQGVGVHVLVQLVLVAAAARR